MRVQSFKRTILVVILSVISNSGCWSPTSRKMLVARVGGDIYLPHLEGVSWGSDEPVDCELASQQNGGFSSPFSLTPSPAPDDVLLCGNKTLTAWSVTSLRPDIKTEIYRVSEKRSVDFRNSGHGRGVRDSHRYWDCRLTSDHIDCE